MIFKKVSEPEELQQILDLQHINLRQNISEEEKNSNGFLTLSHSLAQLNAMHAVAPSIIAKEGNSLAGYALVTTLESKWVVQELVPMFDHFDRLPFETKTLGSLSYYAMGQICVAREYRSQGVFDGLYQYHRSAMRANYELLVTEISSANLRSVKAHERVGFKCISTHTDALDNWLMYVWDWR